MAPRHAIQHGVVHNNATHYRVVWCGMSQEVAVHSTVMCELVLCSQCLHVLANVVALRLTVGSSCVGFACGCVVPFNVCIGLGLCGFELCGISDALNLYIEITNASP